MRAAFAALFFASGLAALLHQMIWQRLLAFFSGADVYSVTIIVAAFMAGLGFGSLAGGHLADRLSVLGRLWLFAASELAIAAFAFASVALYYDFLYQRLAGSLRSPALIALVLFVTLLWPTFFMGMSLPLLARSLTTRTDEAATRIGSLYGWNTLGAALGSLLTVWVLVRALGFVPTIRLGAAINLGCAGLALLLAWIGRERGEPVEPPGPAADVVEVAGRAAADGGRWFLIYALSGFVALSLEIVWFRLLGVVLKSNAFTFGTLLALYLAGVGLGSLLGRRLATRSAKPDRTFFIMQSAISVYAGLSITALVAGADRSAALGHLWAYLAAYEGIEIGTALRAVQACILHPLACPPALRELAGLFATLYLLVPAFLVGPPTILMGMSFPFLQKTVQTDLGRVGRRVGWLQAGNIAGSMGGAVCTGLVLLPWIGTAWTLKVLVALGGVFLALAARTSGLPAGAGRGTTAALLAVLIAAGLTPAAPEMWSRLHGTTPDQIVFAEDGSGLSVLKNDPASPGRTVVYVNGLGQSWLPYGGVHSMLGALPALLHPNPREVAVIGLGSGDTVFAVAGRPETDRVDCIEIVAPQLDTLWEQERRRSYPGLRSLLHDARVRYSFTDGRAFIMRAGRRYDIVEADALRPNSAYAGNLYSYEYFRLLGAHLQPGGFAVSWGPTRRIRATFVKAFPHVAVFGPILVGSEAPIAFDPQVLQGRLRDPTIQAYYQRAGIDIRELMVAAVAGGPTRYGPEFDRSGLTDLNADLFPKDEYLVPRSTQGGGLP